MTKPKKKRKRPIGSQLIRLAKTSDGLCVQVILNLPLKDLLEDCLATHQQLEDKGRR